MGQIRHYNNGKWTIFTTGEELSTKSGVTNTYYIGPNLSDGIYTKVDPDGTKIDLESSSGGAQPKIYKALLSQSGTNAPVATVLVNTLSGTPVWSYDGVGNYILTLASEFPQNKTFIKINNAESGGRFNLAYWDSVNTIRVDSADGSGTGYNDLLLYTSFEIEVYP